MSLYLIHDLHHLFPGSMDLIFFYNDDYAIDNFAFAGQSTQQ